MRLLRRRVASVVLVLTRLAEPAQDPPRRHHRQSCRSRGVAGCGLSGVVCHGCVHGPQWCVLSLTIPWYHWFDSSVVSYLGSGGKVGDKITGTAVCDRSKFDVLVSGLISHADGSNSGQDTRLHDRVVLGPAKEPGCPRKPYQVSLPFF